MTLTAVPFLVAADGSVVTTPCRGAASMFTGGVYIDPPASSAGRAKALCRACPVRAECLDWALTNGERYGVWGGLAAYERRALLKRRAEGTVPG